VEPARELSVRSEESTAEHRPTGGPTEGPPQGGPPPGGPPQGPLRATMVHFSSAIALTMLAGLLLQLWVVAFLGWQGPRALYVRSIYTPIGFVVLAVTEGTAVATQVLAGIAVRSGQKERALRLAPTILTASAAALLLTTVAFAAGSGPLLDALTVPEGDRGLVVSFTVGMCLVSAAGLVPLVASAALRGVGAVRTASMLGVGGALLSAGLMVGLDAVTGMGLAAVPLGSLLSTVLVGALAVRALPRAGVRMPTWRLSREGLRQMWSIGLPVAGTFLLLSFVSTGYLRVLRHAGTTEIVAFATAQTATLFVSLGAMAIGSGAAITVTLRFAENRSQLNLAGLVTMLKLVLPLYLVIAASVFVIRRPLSDVLTSDAPIAGAMADYFLWVAPTLLLYGGTLAILTYLEQIGRASWAFVLNLTYFAVILAVAFALPQPVRNVTMARLIAAGNLVGFFTLLPSVWYLVRRPQPQPVRS
jgi:Na+-driven multidrug efflux pump